MRRDFSDAAQQEILQLISQVGGDKTPEFTSWNGDGWSEFDSWISKLDLGQYINRVNRYNKFVLEENTEAEEEVNSVFSDVRDVDSASSTAFETLSEALSLRLSYVQQLASIMEPGKGRFTKEYMSSTLGGTLGSMFWNDFQRLLQRFVLQHDNEWYFNQNKIVDYLKKNPMDMKDDEVRAVMSSLATLNDAVFFEDSAVSIGDDKFGLDIGNGLMWLSDEIMYGSFSGARLHYYDTYVSLMNTIISLGKDSKTFAGSLLKFCMGEATLDVLGWEASVETDTLVKSKSFSTFLAYLKTENTEHYLGKTSITDKLKAVIGKAKYDITGNEKLKDMFDGLEDKLNNALEKMTDGKFKAFDEKATVFVDSDGNVIGKEDAPKFYDRELTLAQIGKEASASASLYEGEFKLGDNGKLDVTVANAEAHASISAGMYVIGADGTHIFSPGINAEVGTSITAFKAELEGQLLGNELLGLNGDVGLTVASAEAKADAVVQFFGKDGKLDVQLGASASAEAIAAELEGSLGVNVLGGEVAVNAGVNVGIGAHADVGYTDGVLKIDVGASLGLGVSVDLEVDVGGMVDTVCDAGEAIWEGVCDVGDAVGDTLSDCWDWATSWW